MLRESVEEVSFGSSASPLHVKAYQQGGHDLLRAFFQAFDPYQLAPGGENTCSFKRIAIFQLGDF